jgi:hypothetical protein
MQTVSGNKLIEVQNRIKAIKASITVENDKINARRIMEASSEKRWHQPVPKAIKRVHCIVEAHRR